MLDSIFQQFANTHWVEWLGMTTGIVGVWFSIKEKIIAWPLFITCYGCYVSISYQYGLHAFMGMNIIFICISLYGLWQWSRDPDGSNDDFPITRTKRGHWPWVGGFLIVGTVAIGSLLDARAASNFPFFDAFATCCGFIAQWMLSRKQMETWIFWILSDLIYLGIFIGQTSWPSIILFSVFILLAVKGWRDWRSILKGT